jgi:hypothetical protein
MKAMDCKPIPPIGADIIEYIAGLHDIRAARGGYYDAKGYTLFDVYW